MLTPYISNALPSSSLLSPPPAVGYGTAFVPAAPGNHTLEIVTWRPQGTLLQEIAAWFRGGAPQLTDSTVVTHPDARFLLKTASSGSVLVELDVLCKGFEEHGAVFAGTAAGSAAAGGMGAAAADFSGAAAADGYVGWGAEAAGGEPAHAIDLIAGGVLTYRVPITLAAAPAPAPPNPALTVAAPAAAGTVAASSSSLSASSAAPGSQPLRDGQDGGAAGLLAGTAKR